MFLRRSLVAILTILASSLGSATAAQEYLPSLQHEPDYTNYTYAYAMEGLTTKSGDWLFVGQPFATLPSNSSGEGVVHVYRRYGSNWSLQQTLRGTAADGTTPGAFGWSMASYANPTSRGSERLVVGARITAGGGRAYIFELDSGRWEQVAELLPSPDVEWQFGGFLAASRDYVAVSDVGFPSTSGVNGQGKVQVYRRYSWSGEWVHQQNLTPPVAGEGGLRFGTGIAMGTCSFSRGYLAVCAPPSGTPGAPDFFAGAVYLYARGLGSPYGYIGQVDALTTSTRFSESLLFDGDRLLVGARGRSSSDLGTIYVIENGTDGLCHDASLGANWTITGQISDHPYEGMDFGGSMFRTPNGFAVRSGFSTFINTAQMSLFEYDEASSAYTRVGILQDPPGASSFFGATFASFDTEMLVSSGTDSANPEIDRHYFPDFSGDETLKATPDFASFETGGTQFFQIDAGPENSGKVYLLLGSASGSEPGFGFQGFQVPLNVPDLGGPFDYFTYSFNGAFGGPSVIDFGFGYTDADGRATVRLDIPPGAPAPAPSMDLTHAAILLEPFGAITLAAVTNPKGLRLTEGAPPLLQLDSVEPEYFADTYFPPVDMRVTPTIATNPIVSYDWTWDVGLSGPTTVTTTEPQLLQQDLPIGRNEITVTATDSAGLQSSVTFLQHNNELPEVTGVSVSPQQPSPGEMVTVSATAVDDSEVVSISYSFYDGIDVFGVVPYGEDFVFTVPPTTPPGIYLSGTAMAIDDDFESQGDVYFFDLLVAP